MKTLIKIPAFFVLLFIIPLNAEAKTDVDFIDVDELFNTNPCPTPTIVFTDTTYTVDQNGHLVINLYLTVNGVAYWVTYNPTTGQTTTDLPSFQSVVGSGPYMNPMLVYHISSGPGCRGIEDTVHFQIPPGTVHCGNGSGNNGNGTGTNGNGSGNNGNGTGTNGNGSGNNGNGTGTNGNGWGNVGGIATDIGSLGGNSKMVIYPNPSTDGVFVGYDPAVYEKELFFILIDKTGTVQFNVLVYEVDQYVDLSTVPNGKYYYHIMTQGNSLDSGILVIE